DADAVTDDVTVLLVDDDETWLASTAQILEHQRAAFSVTTAADLEGARTALAERDPDCVVSDYRLVEGTGLELLDTVRERDPELPFILITGQGDETVASDAIGQRVTDYIPKRTLGGRTDRLARRVETAVDSYRTRQALARERRSKDAMLDILTESSSRRGLAGAFCDHLVGERGYDCAWVGTLDESGGVVPAAVAGAERYVDRVVDPGATPESSDEPAFRALARRDPVVVESIESEDDDGASDGGSDDWVALASDHGFGRAGAAPIVHDGTASGVVAVYGSESTFEPGERDLLAEYGETIGYALRSAAWRESLLSTGAVAVDVELSDRSVPLAAVGERLPGEARIEVLTAVPLEERLRYIVRVTETAAEQFRESAAAVEAVHDTAVTDTDPLRAEVVVSLPTPETVLADHGGRVRSTTVDGRRAAVTAVEGESDVRSLVEALQSSYPDAGVRSVRSVEDADSGPGGGLDDLTEKQRNALEVAYFSGYFERPREHDTTEVAEKLGVSRQTLTQHLRAAERKVLGDVLDENRRR
ncbi:MAG: helix-turn-helix domain-containing protein, partial [Haloplanus sp.]